MHCAKTNTTKILFFHEIYNGMMIRTSVYYSRSSCHSILGLVASKGTCIFEYIVMSWHWLTIWEAFHQNWAGVWSACVLSDYTV